VNRLGSETGICRLAERTHLFRLYVSYGEEVELSPALMVYLGGCNFRCGFCTQAPDCFRPAEGPELLSDEVVARIEALAAGVRWVNLLGGEPSLHPHTLAELRRRVHGPARWLLNTNGYFTRGAFELLNPLVDLHLVDFKFGNDACAQRLAGVPRYSEVLHRNLARIYATGRERVLVRHLLMPGHEACCLEPVARWVSEHLPGIRFRLMTGYVPNYQCLSEPAMSRTVPADIVLRAEDFCRKLGLWMVE
jgi:putative pyruvate formate lyase activating enzyme